MSLAIFAAAGWTVVAAAVRLARPRGLLPVWLLIAGGVPIIGWLVLSHGPWIGLLALGLGAAALRWTPGARFSVGRVAGSVGRDAAGAGEDA